MFHVGDKVKIIKNIGTPEYDKFIGKEAIIKRVGDDEDVRPYLLGMKENDFLAEEEELELVPSQKYIKYYDLNGIEVSDKVFKARAKENQLLFGNNFVEKEETSKHIIYKIINPSKLVISSTPLGKNYFYDEFQQEYKGEFMEESKMELKNIKKENIKEAKDKYNEERKNAEVEIALAQLRDAQNQKDEIDRQIKVLEENKKPHQEVIDMFKGK